MSTAKQIIVNTVPTEYSKGSASTSRLQGIYTESPLWKDMTDDERKKYFQDNVLDGTRETGFLFDGFDTSYVGDDKPLGGAPDLNEVKTGGGGLPASPFVPNPTSPGPGSMNATDQAAAPEGFGKTPSDQWGSGVGHALQPKNVAEKIGEQKLGDYILGQSTSTST